MTRKEIEYVVMVALMMFFMMMLFVFIDIVGFRFLIFTIVAAYTAIHLSMVLTGYRGYKGRRFQ